MILFDEIEKAHPDVFNILLQVLDDGHLTDTKGRTVDFRNTVIIMTSKWELKNYRTNALLVLEVLQKVVTTKLSENNDERIKNSFRPEFLNRVDDIIVFHKLKR